MSNAIFLQFDKAAELNKVLIEKCENAALESEMLVNMTEQV